MIRSKKQMFIVVGVFCLVLLLGTVTYAFFNYTRTGSSNVIKTGRVTFNAEQGDTVTLDGLFPITTTGEINASTPGVGSLSIHVTGDTTYNEGIEYLVKAVNVTSSNGTELPISVKIDYTANNNKTIGTADDSYYTNRGGNSSIYKLLSTDTIEDNGELVVGYIAPDQTGIDGNITIMAWLDAANIAITDTIEGGNIEVPGYDNGTDTDWINGRTVFTTEQWNALTANGVSFQIKVEANEGVWIEAPQEPIPTINSCPGCKFIYTTSRYYYSANNYFSSPLSTLTTFESNNETLTDDYRTLNKNYFLGFKFDGSGNVTNAYACGIKGEDPNNGTAFCIEGALSDTYGGNSEKRTAIYNANKDILNPIYGPYDSETGLGCNDNGSNINCNGSVYAYIDSNFDVHLGGNQVECNLFSNGIAECSEY